MNEVRESWEDIIDIISSLAGDNYITRKLYINDYGRGIIKYNNREWTSDNISSGVIVFNIINF